MADLDGTDEFFDSRDVIARIEELEDEREEWLISDRKEYDELVRFRDEAEREFEDWRYGVTFTHEDSLAEWAKEYAEDVDGVQTSRWPFKHIDWQAAADELKEDDLKEVTLHGVTYWGR